jgi:hypothetical protein
MTPAMSVPGSGGAREPSVDRLSAVCRITAATLLFFLCVAHLGVLLCFVLGTQVSSMVAPGALVLALIAGDRLGRANGFRGRLLVAPLAIALIVMAGALALSAAFFDLSWDGLWYHQTAAYQMAKGWNPLADPMHVFTPHLQSWLRYYAKGPWYVALAFYQTTHAIEWAKAATWVALAAAFLAVLAASIDLGVRRRAALAIAALIALNPVVTCQLLSFLVDGLMVSFLACYVAAMVSALRRPSSLTWGVVVASAVLCVNAKLNGLVYLCFFAAAGGLYVIARRRNLLMRYVLVNAGALLLATLVFGFNPYVTNTIHRHHPFYPVLGTRAHPSYAQLGRDPIERYETPHNMVGRSRFVRLAYAVFGRPGSQPFFEGPDARLMWPFDARWGNFAIFYFHEVRIAGFGPLFSGVLLVSGVLFAGVLRRRGARRDLVLLASAAIVSSLLVSQHTWWARYGPQLWWLPILPIAAVLGGTSGRLMRWTARGAATLLLANALLVAFVHLRWEIAATRATEAQLAELRGKGEIDVDLQYFAEPFGERLRAGGVRFRVPERLACADPVELTSVAPGYPGAVRACVPKE